MVEHDDGSPLSTVHVTVSCDIQRIEVDGEPLEDYDAEPSSGSDHITREVDGHTVGVWYTSELGFP